MNSTRKHPTMEDVFEYDMSDIFPIAAPRSVCVGCPYYNRDCPPRGTDEDCGAGMVWYATHLHIANLLEESRE